jgi:ATP-dependent RNA helicase DHX37/DHR1
MPPKSKSPLLSAELQVALGPDALLPTRRKSPASSASSTAPQAPNALNRRQRKRLAQLEAKRETEAARNALIRKLEAQRLSATTLVALASSVSLGDARHRRTKRERAAQLQREVAAGVPTHLLSPDAVDDAVRRDARASSAAVSSDDVLRSDHAHAALLASLRSKRRRADVDLDADDEPALAEHKRQLRAADVQRLRAERRKTRHVQFSANGNDDDDDDDDDDDGAPPTLTAEPDEDAIDSSEERGAESSLQAETQALTRPSAGFDFGALTFSSPHEAHKAPRKKRRAIQLASTTMTALADAADDEPAGGAAAAVLPAAQRAVRAAAKSVFSKGDNVVVSIHEPTHGELDALRIEALVGAGGDVADDDASDDHVAPLSATELADASFGLTPSNASVEASIAASLAAGTSGAVKLNPPEVRLRADKTPYVVIDRDPALVEKRRELPIISDEYRFLELLVAHDTLVVCGETGSGKTTQVPQFLLEAGFACDVGVAEGAAVGSPDGRSAGRIGVTQPRRVAAESVARRVAVEVGAPMARFVGFQVRHRRAVTAATRVKFMTDGILLRELQTDFLLSSYSVLVLDEAHERTLNTDVLIGLLSRVVALRRSMFDKRETTPAGAAVHPLKLVIMSATLRVSDFVDNKRLFAEPPPVLHIAGRQHKVTVHFNKVTAGNYVAEAHKKLVKLHQQLPVGGVLVFLAGQQEIDLLARKLRAEFSKAKAMAALREAKRIERDRLIERDPTAPPSAADAPIECDEAELPPNAYLDVVPLYSRLTPEQQQLAFDDVPHGARRCVLATNVAETSLTLPHIKYVIDSGRHKVLLHDARSGVSRYVVDFISQASAAQRAGRAGRISEGHAYRLYSSALYGNEMAEFDEPEVLRMPVAGVVLQMKAMGIRDVATFPFPTPPPPAALAAACESLFYLGALVGDKADQHARNSVSPLGRLMARFPVTPRMAKILVLGNQFGCLEYAIALVAALTVQSPLLRLDDIDFGDDDADDADDADAGGGAAARKAAKATTDEVHIRAAAAAASVDPYRRVSKVNPKKVSADLRRQRGAALARAQAAFFDTSSDALTSMRAAGAFEFAKSGGKNAVINMAAWCGDRRVMFRVLQEMQDLRVQLTAAAAEVVDDGPVRDKLRAGVDPHLPPPSEAQCGLLRQLVCAGFCDRIARLRRVQEPHAGTPNGPPLLYDTVLGAEQAVEVRVTHMPNETEDERLAREARQMDGVAVHPSSIVRRCEPPPEYVAYTDLLRTDKRTWMRGCTVIEARWLSALLGPFISHGPPLELPRPHYSAERDTIVCHVSPTVVPIGWVLPPCEQPMPESRDRCRWFAVAFLRGDVCRALAPLVDRLSSAPALAARPQVPASKAALVAALSSAGISTRQQLLDSWKVAPAFLLGEYLAWVERDVHDFVKAMWPPVSNEASPDLPRAADDMREE